MCLSGEHYLDTCYEQVCVEAAEERLIIAKVLGGKVSGLAEEFYRGRSGNAIFLWKGYSDAPCEHIMAVHGPECHVVKRVETDYGLLFDTCNCDQTDNGWEYY